MPIIPGRCGVVDHQRQQVDGRGILAHRVLDVPADQEQVVHPGVGEAGKELAEVIAIADHARRNVHRHRVVEPPQPGR